MKNIGVKAKITNQIIWNSKQTKNNSKQTKNKKISNSKHEDDQNNNGGRGRKLENLWNNKKPTITSFGW